MLVNAKANTDDKNEDGETPLHLAAFSGHKACMQILLNARASIDSVDNRGYTALAMAIHEDQQECAEVLLYCGAKMRKVSKVFIPDCMNDIIARFNNFKAAYTVLYGILRWRTDVPFLFNPKAANPTPVMLLICAALLETRFDEEWEE